MAPDMTGGRVAAGHAAGRVPGSVPMFVVILIASAISLRTPITSVSAALDEVTNAYGLSGVSASILVSLPLVMFALAAPLGPWLAARVGIDRALVLLQCVLATALVLRTLSTWLLLIGTALVAAAITGISILAAAVFRRGDQRSAATLTAAFTVVFGVGAAVGALLALPLIDLLGGSVPLALSAWAVPAIVGAIVLALVPARAAAPDPEPLAAGRIRDYFRYPAAWALTAYFGLQQLIFFGVTAWLPTLLRDRGLDPQAASVTYVVVSLVGLVGSFVAPRIGMAPRHRPWLVLLIAVATIAGLLGLAAAPLGQRMLWAILLGLAQGAVFALSLAFVVFRATTPSQAASLSAMTQGLGYGAAALGPLAMGLLHDLTASWTLPVALLIVTAIAEGIVGLQAGREEPVVPAMPGEHPGP